MGTSGVRQEVVQLLVGGDEATSLSDTENFVLVVDIVLLGQDDSLAVVARHNLGITNIGDQKGPLAHVGNRSSAANTLTIGFYLKW